jgi:hypothetical protein
LIINDGGKKALLDVPKGHLNVIRPPDDSTVTTGTVQMPKQGIMHDKMMFGPYILPRIPKNGTANT